MLLEIVVFNYNSALKAYKCGADRLELCDNHLEGGTTPSYGMVSELRKQLNIPLFPMIRPRGGDFLYSSDEIRVMIQEIVFFKKLGCEGVVLGCLDKNGNVDCDNLYRLVEAAYPMEVTFHRAFDRVRDRSDALNNIYNSGCNRILTSGGYPTVVEGLECLKRTIEESKGKVRIVAGGGVDSVILPKILIPGLTEIHSPSKKIVSSLMNYTNTLMNEQLESITVDEDEMLRMTTILKQIKGSI